MIWFPAGVEMMPTPAGTYSQLQSMVASQAAVAVPAGERASLPHHPINCQQELLLDEDGTFRCPHATAPPGDVRTQAALNSSIAYMLIEELLIREGHISRQ